MTSPERMRPPEGGPGNYAGSGNSGVNSTTLADAMAPHGLAPPDHIEPGKFHRIPGAGKGAGNRSGWCKVLEDGQAVAFGDWSTGLSETWQARKPANNDELEHWRKLAEQAKREAEAERLRKHEKAAATVEQEWQRAEPASPDHRYLKHKCIQAFGIRQAGDNLIIPICNEAGEIRSIQRIGPDGSKRFAAGGEIKGNFHSIGEPSDTLIICEGYATAASIHQSTGHAVTVSFNCGNLQRVAETMRAKYPDMAIIIAADNDTQTEGNPGRTKAEQAARATGAAFAMPPDHGDFNDLANAAGFAATAEIIKSATKPEPDLNAEIERLSKLSALEYDRERTEAAKALKVRPATLDAEIKQARQAKRSNDEPGALDFEDVEPWPDPVNGAALLDDLVEIVKRHTITAEHVPQTVALWIAFSYLIDVVRVAPILAITSPEKRCGKTTLLALLVVLVRKALPAANITPAAVFRAIELWRPTLAIDEADTFIKASDELRGVVNSGHTRASAFVIRTVGDDHEPRKFSTWGAKAIAMIGRLPDTLADRSIPVEMRRKLPGEKVDRLRGHPFEETRRKLARFALDHAEAIRQAEPEIPQGLNDRAGDNWEPLLSIADAAGHHWPATAQAAAMALSGAEHETESLRTMLLSDMRRLLIEHKALSSTEMAEKLSEMEDRPWPEFGRSGKPITPTKVAQLVAAFAIKPERLNDLPGHTRGTRGYRLESAANVFERYLPPVQSVAVSQANNHGHSGDSQSVATGNAETVSKSRKANNDGHCDTATLSTPPDGDESEDFEI